MKRLSIQLILKCPLEARKMQDMTSGMMMKLRRCSLYQFKWATLRC